MYPSKFQCNASHFVVKKTKQFKQRNKGVMMRHQYCLPPAAVLALVAAAATVAHGQQGGGWKQIPNLKDPLVQEIANFAVSE